MRLLFYTVLTMSLSPIWPLGQNPLPGDPYVIINKQTNELAYIDHGKIQKVYPASTGKTADLTPEGEFTIMIKAKDPYYRRKILKAARRITHSAEGGLDLMREEPTGEPMAFMEQVMRHR